ncbi:MAG TPA: molybdopterin-dependent oxidoreductase [Gallionellaceae bacterium]
MPVQQIHGYCALCISRCGCIATVEDGVLRKVEADPAHPTGGAFCAKGRAAPELVNSSERILHPLRRVGPRAAPTGWERISWDVALDEIATKLRQASAAAGPESVAFSVTTPSGTAISDSFAWIHRLARAFGTPNVVFATENCNWHKDFSPQDTFGSGIGMPELAQTGCLLLWGANPSSSWLSLSLEIRRARQRGMKLIVVDPRGAGMARGADVWLQPRPGTDGALALAMAQAILEQGGEDRAFLRRWSNAPFLVRADNGCFLTAADVDAGGSPKNYLAWDESQGQAVAAEAAGDCATLALSGNYTLHTRAGSVSCRPAFAHYAEACAAMPPERAAELTGVPAQQIRQAAQLMLAAAPSAFFTWTGLCQHSDATQTTRALCLLYALTGQLDAPGGNVFFPRPPINDASGLNLLPPGMLEKTVGRAERPLGPGRRGWLSARDLDEDLARPDGTLKGLFAFGGNPLQTKPLSPEFARHLERLDFFAISEMFMTPTTALADIVLPAASAWEREALYAGFHVSREAEAHLQLRPACVAPRGEAKSDTWIVFELAKRLGLAEHFFGADAAAALQHVLGPTGITAETLRANPQGITLDLPLRYRKYETAGFATPTGRVEIYSEAFLRHGYAPVPRGDVPAADDARWPLTLLSVKHVPYCHSQMRQLPSLRRAYPEPTADIHPVTAAQRGIAEGAWMLLSTARGRLAVKARFNAAQAPDVVCASYGWHEAMQPELAAGLPPGVSLNFAGVVDPAACDAISGSDALKRVPCEVQLLES